MPIYEYQCEGCEYEFESLQRMSEPPLKQCPSCGKDRLKKKISAVAFRLKGGGWYETDFKKDGDKKRNLAGDGGGSATANASAESKPAESKPAEKKAEKKADPAPKTEAKPAT